MISKFDGKCYKCNGVLPKGTEINYDRKMRKASHIGDCPIEASTAEQVTPPSISVEAQASVPTQSTPEIDEPLDKGEAGGSGARMAQAKRKE